MKLFPSSANQQLEFDKVQNLLALQCRSDFARQKANSLRIHTRKEFIEPELQQTHEYKLLFLNHLHFPDDVVFNLSKELKAAQRLMTLNKDNKPHFLDNPHIIIAGKLAPWQYEKGWLDYSHRQFTGRFIADSMLLIKRKVGEKAYQVVKRFEFMNLPVITKQGELFAPVP